MSDLTERDTGWAILPADPLTGKLLDESERTFRERIRSEAQEGMVGIDTLYLSTRRTIHQPLADEQGEVSGDGWILERPNNTTLRVAYSEGLESAALAEAAVTIARGDQRLRRRGDADALRHRQRSAELAPAAVDDQSERFAGSPRVHPR